jgi:hypothetical protein
VITALTPQELWPKLSERSDPNKTYTYSAQSRCLKDFQAVYTKAKDESHPDHDLNRELYEYYLDIAPYAYALYEKWRKHPEFRGRNRIVQAIKKEGSGVKEVPDGIVFPILAALSAFVRRTEVGWRVVEPASFEDGRLIDTAIRTYRDTAGHNPQTMGKRKACYSPLYQITSLYRELSNE